MKKNLESSKLDILSSDERANIIRPVYNPIDKKGSLKILKGSLAPEGAVVKIASIKSASFLGKARTTSS